MILTPICAEEQTVSDMKTQPTDGNVAAFLNAIEDDRKREDALAVLEMMREVTGEDPVMWGESIIGFGTYSYRYASGREGEWFKIGFSPRKRNLTLYIMSGFDQYGNLLSALGKHKTGKSCLYISKLDDIDTTVLRELAERSVAHVSEAED